MRLPGSRNDSVSWNRLQTTGTDVLGNVVQGNAPGFPQALRGSFQSTSKGTRMTDAGVVVDFDAMFITDDFHSGQSQDTVTKDGVMYRVVRSEPTFALFSPNIDSTVYYLKAQSQQVG